jgi:hydroxymethylpyrimidine pyrophosphatase-like HAD family hydrolase
VHSEMDVMQARVLALDLDGTLGRGGGVAAETWDALRRARNAGLSLVLVTGRLLDTLHPKDVYEELFDAIVAENGAVVRLPGRDSVAVPFGRLPPDLVERLKERDVPLNRGTAIVGTRVPYDRTALAVLDELGYEATIEHNRGAVMVLPPGATKSSGLRYALQELGLPAGNVVACGDGENDRSLFEVAGLSAAVADAVPGLLDRADVVLPEGDGAGVRSLIDGLLAGRIAEFRVTRDKGPGDPKPADS